MTWYFLITTASESSTVSGASSASSSVKKGPEIATEAKTGGTKSLYGKHSFINYVTGGGGCSLWYDRS